MQLYHTTDPHGVTEICPSEARMCELIDELDDLDPSEVSHPDVALIHNESGWMVTLYQRGIASLENLDDKDEAPRHMKGVTRKKALKLWGALSSGFIDSVLNEDWLNSK